MDINLHLQIFVPFLSSLAFSVQLSKWWYFGMYITLHNYYNIIYFPINFIVSVRLEPIMLKNLPIIPSRTSQKFYPLFLIYSFIILLVLLNQ